MILLTSVTKAQKQLVRNMKSLRLGKGLTQEGLADRSGVSLPTLRKFEQKGLISLASFLKICMTLGCLDKLMDATAIEEKKFSSIDDILKEKKAETPKRGWRK